MKRFNFGKRNEVEEVQPDWIPLLEERQNRLYVFLEKLEQSMQELTDAAIPELEALRAEDERDYGNMLNGVKGQLNTIRQKAYDTYEEKVEGLYIQIRQCIDALHPFSSTLTDFRRDCSERFHHHFEDEYTSCQKRLDSTNFTDYEALYQQIVDEYELIKDQFNCHQCGSKIPIEKIYFTVTHLACSSCQTKNTFQPSTLAQGLEHIGRGLAEQRTQPLLQKYYQAQQDEHQIYLQAHKLKLSVHGIDSPKEKEQLLAQIADLKNQEEAIKKSIPSLYQKYQRAMFDEWKILVPDLAEQTKNFYQNLQKRKF